MLSEIYDFCYLSTQKFSSFPKKTELFLATQRTDPCVTKLDITYVYLSNMEDISFERAMRASGLSSSLEQFSPEEAVLVDIYTGDTEESTNPTGYPTEEVGQPQLRYNGTVYYYFATGFDEPLPKGYNLVGTVTDVDNTQAPEENLHGARVDVGQEITLPPTIPVPFT